MLRNTRGFTIVEILLVIAVLGILTAIVVVSWSGVASGSRDRTRDNDVKQWIATFDLYKGRFFVWPGLPVSDTTPAAYCLGQPTQGGSPKVYLPKCIQYTTTTTFDGINSGTNSLASGTDYTNLTTEVSKVGNIPENNGTPIKNLYAGPFVYLWQSTSGSDVTVYGRFTNFFENTCPAEYTNITSGTQPTPAPPSTYASLFTGVANTNTCFVQKSFTYTAS